MHQQLVTGLLGKSREILQGTGIGKRFFIFAEEEARRLGHGEMRLYTAEAMTENIALYTRSGWVEYDRFEQKGYPRVFMRKLLSGAGGACADVAAPDRVAG